MQTRVAPTPEHLSKDREIGASSDEVTEQVKLLEEVFHFPPPTKGFEPPANTFSTAKCGMRASYFRTHRAMPSRKKPPNIH